MGWFARTIGTRGTLMTNTVLSVSKPQPPKQDITTLREARDSARRLRAEWLVAVAEGLVSVDDVIREAATEEGRPLLKISLRQLLLSQPFVGGVRKDQVMKRMAGTLSSGNVTAKTNKCSTVFSLLDTRAGGRRYIAFQDARMSRNTPMAGFPFSSLKVSGDCSESRGGEGR